MRRCTTWLSGRALHGGQRVRARVVHDDDRRGLWVRRADSPGAPEVRLTPAALLPAWGATVIADAHGRPFASTIEHVLSALQASRTIEGVVVELDGAELPCLDGAAERWLDALAAASMIGLGARPITLREPIERSLGRSRLRLEPADDLELCVTVEIDPPRRRWTARWDGSLDAYRSGIAPARTFATLDEAQKLLAAGKARGVDPASAVVFAATGPMSPLRFDDEPARHKLLDLAGDLAVLGGRLCAHVVAERPSHALTSQTLARGWEASAFLPR